MAGLQPKLPNLVYEIVPPGGDPGRPIRLLGREEYSPGTSRRFNDWRVELPEEYAARFGNPVVFDSYWAACSALAKHFFDGSEAALKKWMTLRRC